MAVTRAGILLTLAANLWAGVSVSTIGTTQQQAVIRISGASGGCTIELSEAATYTPLVPDVDASKYNGANIDTSRADTIQHANGDRDVTLGHLIDDRSLAPDVTYYGRLSACGSATFTITTSHAAMGFTQGYPIPINRNKWGNRGNQPTLAQILAKTTIPDPVAGVKTTPSSGLEDVTWVWPGGGAAFARVDGGAGWTNPLSILNGGSSTATTTNSNPIDLYMGAPSDGRFEEYWYNRSLTDLALMLYGAGANITVCAGKHPADGCIGGGFNVTMPSGSSMSQVTTGASADSDHPFPASFPKAMFDAWGLGEDTIRTENRLTHGTLSATAGLIMLDGWSTETSNIPVGTKHGDKMYIAGSSGLTPSCVNNFCTIDHAIDTFHLQLVEAITAPSGTAYEIPGFFVRIVNAQPGKTLHIGARWKAAGVIDMGLSSAGNANCGIGDPFTSGHTPPKKLKLCSVPVNGVDYFYLLGEDGWSSVYMTHTVIPPLNYFTDYLRVSANDAPHARVGGWCCNMVRYAPKDARSWYAYIPNRQWNGSDSTNRWATASLWLVTYEGDGTESHATNYSSQLGGDSWPAYGIEGSGPTATFNKQRWQLILGQNNNFVSQLSAFPKYETAFYGTYFEFQGITTGGLAYFLNQYSGMPQNGPAWVAVQDTKTGQLVNLMHTMDGTGFEDVSGINMGGSWGGSHNVTVQKVFPDTATITLWSMFENNTSGPGGSSSIIFGGAWQTTPTAVLRGGTWNTNTCLGWPAGDNGHCPGIPAPDTDCTVLAPGNPYQFAGATGNSCVAITVPPGGVCNIHPHQKEVAHTTGGVQDWLCPWNSNYSHPFSNKLGDVFTDPADKYGEYMRLVAINSGGGLGGGDKWVLQRNSQSQNVCVDPGPLPGSHCRNATSQNWHNDRFSLWASAAGINGDQQAGYLVHGGAKRTVQVSSGDPADDHPTTTQSGPDQYITASHKASSIPGPLDHMFDIPVKFISYGSPVFATTGIPIGNGSVQSYFSAVPSRLSAMDYNSLNNNGGGAHAVVANRDMVNTPTANVYKIEIAGSPSVDPRLFFYYAWAGSYLLEDVSGPDQPSSGPATGLGTPYTFCVPHKNGECYAGSSVSDVGSHGGLFAYVNVPVAYTKTTTCNADVPWANIPCVLIGWPGVGAVREQDITKSGNGFSRILGYFMAFPGDSRPYAAAEPITDKVFWGAPNRLGGFFNAQFSIQVLQWYSSGTPTINKMVPHTLTIPAGPRYVDVRYGYSRFIGPNASAASGYCHTRREACSASSGSAPYVFDSDAKTLISNCGNGCSATVNIMGPNVAYAVVRRSADGVTWTDGEPAPVVENGIAVVACADLAYSVTAATVGTSGGSGAINITVTDQTCASVHNPSAPWLTLTAASGGCSLSAGTAKCTGNGSLTWSAASNGGVARAATILSDSDTVTFVLSQDGSITCTFSIAPSLHDYSAAGESQVIAITASDSSCAWTANEADWLTLDTSAGTGSATIHATASANSGSARNTTVTIAGQGFSATQDAGTAKHGVSASPRVAVTPGVGIQ